MNDVDKRGGDATSYMTDRMVMDRCLRMYRNSQWKRLHDFCMKDPRAQTWTMQRIARTHHVPVEDPRVLELFSRLETNLTPRARIETVVPGQTVSAEDIVEEVADDFVEEVDLRSLDLPEPTPRPVAPVVATLVDAPLPSTGADAPTLPEAFTVARDNGDYPEAGRQLLSLARRLAPGVQVPIMAVEFREVAAELAREGEFKLLVDLCSTLPSRTTASAMIDLGEKLKLGAHVNSPALKLKNAERDKASKGTIKDLQAALVETARKALGG